MKEKINGITFDTLDKKSVNDAISFIVEKGQDWLIDAGRISNEIAKENFSCQIETRKLIEQLEIVL